MRAAVLLCCCSNELTDTSGRESSQQRDEQPDTAMLYQRSEGLTFEPHIHTIQRSLFQSLRLWFMVYVETIQEIDILVNVKKHLPRYPYSYKP
jgi:hypothetical protein